MYDFRLQHFMFTLYSTPNLKWVCTDMNAFMQHFLSARKLSSIGGGGGGGGECGGFLGTINCGVQPRDAYLWRGVISVITSHQRRSLARLLDILRQVDQLASPRQCTGCVSTDCVVCRLTSHTLSTQSVDKA